MSYITHYRSVAILHGETGLIISDNTSLAMYICPTVYKKKGSFNLCQLFENQVVKVSKKGWHSLKYCVNMVIICVNMVILCTNKRLINYKSD